MNFVKSFLKKIKDKNKPLLWRFRPLPYKTKRECRRAKKWALGAYEITGLQHHIMPMGNGVIIIDSNWRKKYNKLKGVKKVNINDLLRMAHFSTPQGKRIITKEKNNGSKIIKFYQLISKCFQKKAENRIYKA